MPRNAGAVYRALAPAVLGYLRAERVPDPDDVLGEVFLHVTRDLPRFDGDDGALRRWVFSIAHNRIVDDARRRARHPVEVRDDLPDRAVQAPPDPVDPELIAALHALTDDQREVVVLRFVADLPLEEVARLSGRSVGAVKALQHRALENLSKAVSREARPSLT